MPKVSLWKNSCGVIQPTATGGDERVHIFPKYAIITDAWIKNKNVSATNRWYDLALCLLAQVLSTKEA